MRGRVLLYLAFAEKMAQRVLADSQQERSEAFICFEILMRCRKAVT